MRVVDLHERSVVIAREKALYVFDVGGKGVVMFMTVSPPTREGYIMNADVFWINYCLLT